MWGDGLAAHHLDLDLADCIVGIVEAEHECLVVVAFGDIVFGFGGLGVGRHRQYAKAAKQNLSFG